MTLLANPTMAQGAPDEETPATAGEETTSEGASNDAPDPPLTPPARSPADALFAAQQAFQDYQFAKIRELLEPTLYPTPLFTDKAQRLEARALLGVGLHIQAQVSADPTRRDALTADAYANFLELLREDPRYELDPLIYPPTAIEFMIQVREENADELSRLHGDDKSNPSNDGTAQTIYIERATRERNFALNFAPFALGQFQNNQPAKGTALAMLQGGALALNIGAYIRNERIISQLPGRVFGRDDNNNIVEDYETANTFVVLQYVGLGLFFAVYSYSVIDAVVFYEPEELLQLRKLDGPPPELLPNSLAPPAPLQLQWSWRF